ncbi:MAG: hypothetical protein D6741_04125, partial [Planctomycetota bacterium]
MLRIVDGTGRRFAGGLRATGVLKATKRETWRMVGSLRQGWLVLACLLGAAIGAPESRYAQAENWPRFRGENGQGISDQKGFPVSFSPGDFAWSVELPGVGHSSPIIWEGSLFVTSAIEEGAVRYLHCLDAATGEHRWTVVYGLNRSHKHKKNSWASSTPATDG